MTEDTGNLLLDRIRRYDIALPRVQPLYDRIFVAPIEDDLEKYEGSVLYMAAKSKDKLNASRGVVVAAGLKALDEMRGHGADLGHIVWYARLSPWERVYQGVGPTSGKAGLHTVAIIRSSELTGSQDLLTALRAGALSFGLDADGRHVYTDTTERTDPPENDEGI